MSLKFFIRFFVLAYVITVARAGGATEDSGENGNCESGQIIDCAFNCVAQSDITAQTGDGICNDGLDGGPILTCKSFDCDGGDCGDVCDEPIASFAFDENSGSSVESSSGEYSGFFVNDVSWVSDPKFGVALQCNSAEQGTIRLTDIPYGSTGQFAIQLWFNHGEELNGSGFEYLFSHGNDDLTDPNGIHIYFPQVDAGVNAEVKALVFDSNDGELSFVEKAGAELSSPSDLNLVDQQWHMITITTIPTIEGIKGIRLYVDSVTVSETLNLSGGDFINPDGFINICGTDANDALENSFFNGRVARLKIFNHGLTTGEVAALFTLEGGEKNLLEVILSFNDLSTFNSALSAANIASTVQSQVNEFTIFAPSNTAFDNVFSQLDGIQDLDDLLDSPSLAGILQQHIVPGKFLSSELSDGQNLTTLSGTPLQVTIAENAVQVNGIPVTEANLLASNGVLHRISQVIVLDSDPTACLLSQISGTECCELDAVPGSGDLDFNGSILVTDIIIVVNYIIGLIPSPDACVEVVADVNFDTDVSVVDVINIVNNILGV